MKPIARRKSLVRFHSGTQTAKRVATFCAVLAVGIPFLGMRAFGQGPEFRWHPAAVTGADYTIDDQRGNPGIPSEVTLTGVLTAPAEVTLELDMSDWGDAPGAPTLGSYMATMDCLAGFASGEGANLFQIDCFVYQPHPYFVFGSLPPPCYFMGGASGEVCCELGGAILGGCSLSDPGEIMYGGTAVVGIPTAAAGTYTIPFLQLQTKTFMNDPFGVKIEPLTNTAVKIAIPTGKCCYMLGPDMECTDGISETICASFSEGYEFTPGEVCTGSISVDCNADCNHNGVSDAEDIASGTSEDCNTNGTPDECDLDRGVSDDCDRNAVPDECDAVEHDCNNNGIPDVCDIREAPTRQPPNSESGAFADVDCQPCEGPQAVAEDFVLSEPRTISAVAVWGGYYPDNDPGPSADFTLILHEDDGGLPGSVVPIETSVYVTRQRTDVTVLGIDEWRISFDFAEAITLDPGTYHVEVFENSPGATNTFFWETGDIDPITGISGLTFAGEAPGATWIPEAMDLAFALLSPSPRDCNNNGVLDECDLADGTSQDCNENDIPDECDGDCNNNGIADECDLTLGTSSDDNANDIPDECEVPRNRYLLLPAATSGPPVAYRVEMIESTYFPDSTGVLGWVGPPNALFVSRIVNDPHFSDAWPTAVYLGDCPVVPVAVYEIRPTEDGVTFGDPIVIPTIAQPTPPPPKWWADVVGVKTVDGWTAPDGYVNMDDIQAAIQSFERTPGAPHWTWVDVAEQVPDMVVNLTDVQFIIFAFQSDPYPFADPADCSGEPRIGAYANSGCLPEEPRGSGRYDDLSCPDDQFQFTVDDGSLYVVHESATYNCCPEDIVVSLSIEGSILHLAEEEIPAEWPCPCLCCYNVDATVVNLDPGTYTVEFCWQDWETAGEQCYIEVVLIP